MDHLRGTDGVNVELSPVLKFAETNAVTIPRLCSGVQCEEHLLYNLASNIVRKWSRNEMKFFAIIIRFILFFRDTAEESALLTNHVHVDARDRHSRSLHKTDWII